MSRPREEAGNGPRETGTGAAWLPITPPRAAVRSEDLQHKRSICISRRLPDSSGSAFARRRRMDCTPSFAIHDDQGRGRPNRPGKRPGILDNRQSCQGESDRMRSWFFAPVMVSLHGVDLCLRVRADPQQRHALAGEVSSSFVAYAIRLTVTESSRCSSWPAASRVL